MSVRQSNVIDGMGIDREANKLVFLITDPYGWAVQEYEHLTAYKYTENGEAFLNAGKKQLKERNIDFIYSVAKGD